MKYFSNRFNDFVNEIGSPLHKPNNRFLKEYLYGLLKNKSVLLSNIGRALNEPCDLIHTEKRLSRNMGSDRFDDDLLYESYLDFIEDFVWDENYPLPTIAVDTTDIAKPRAKSMPRLGKVWDGSKKTTANGYNILSIEAVGINQRRLPLCSKLYASGDNYLDVLKSEIEKLSLRVPGDALWAFDRGYDGFKVYSLLQHERIRYVIRQDTSKKRWVWVGDDHVQMDEIMPEEWSDYQTRILKKGLKIGHVDRVYIGDKNERGVHTGEATHQEHLLVVVTGTGIKPIVLLSNAVDANPVDIANAYMDRWGVEEAHRFVKQSFDLEDVRSLTWKGLERSVFFVMLAYGFLATLVHKDRKETEKFIKIFKSFGKTPVYLYYRLVMGIGQVLEVKGRSNSHMGALIDVGG